jgi:hypothetical protein
MDKNILSDDSLREYIDNVVAAKVKAAVAEALAEFKDVNGAPPFASPFASPFAPESLFATVSTSASPEKPITPVDPAPIAEKRFYRIAPMVQTPELDMLWINEETEKTQTESVSVAPITIAPATPVVDEVQIESNSAGNFEETRKSRFGLRRKISFLVIGVLALAACVQVLGSAGIVDFNGYSELTSALFGNIFGG